MTALAFPQRILHSLSSFFSRSPAQGAEHPILSQKYAKKWMAAGLCQQQLLANPLCAKQIVQLNLHHVFRTWEGILRENPSDRQLEVIVDGVWKEALPFLQGIKAQWDGWQSIQNPGEFWSCTGFGFEKRHPSDWTHLRKCAELSPEQLSYAQQIAAKLPSPLASENKSCVLEIISGDAFKNGFSLFNGIRDIYASPQHPFMHLIDEEGSVRANGFWPAEELKIWKFFSTFPGRFRSPDNYICVPFHRRVVTRIAISRQQHDELIGVMERYQKEGKRFSIRHNCTAFVTDILHRVGFQKVDSRIIAFDFLGRCLPLFVQKIFSPLIFIANKIRTISCYILRPMLNLMKAIGRKVQVVGCKLFGKPATRPPEQVPFLGSNPDNLLRYPLPKRILEWQKEQASSTIYPKNSSFYALYRDPTV